MAAMLSIGAVAFAQTTGQNPTGAAGQAGAPTAAGQQAGDRTQTKQQVTIVGCVQSETDYRETTASGRGGTMGTGIGVGNEFVLINAMPGSASMTSSIGSPASSMPTDPTATTAAGTASTTAGTTATGTATATTGTATTPTATTPETAGTSGSAASPAQGAGSAYALTGNREKDLQQHVGQKVEIVGTLEGGARSDAATTTAGTTGSAGTQRTQRVGDLPQIDITSFRAVGPCSK